MISEIDEALRSLVRAEAIAGSDLDVVFDAPTKDWAARRNAPTINLYLYDIREDVRRREQGWRETRGPDGVVTSRRPMPRHFKLSYLVTAWTQRPEDEHRLLSELLRCFIKQDVMPTEFLTGSLAETGMEVPVTVALPPPEDRAFADVWSALGGELKPSLDVVVIAPIDVGVARPAGPPVLEGTRLDLSDRSTGTVDFDRYRHDPDGSPRVRRLNPSGNGPAQEDQTDTGTPGARSGKSDSADVAGPDAAKAKGRARTPRAGRRA